MAKIDLTARRFGRLKVIGEAEPFVKNRRLTRAWVCQCDCGKTVVVRQHSLTEGSTKSCGCLFEEKKEQITAFGATRGTREWSRLTGIPGSVIRGRLRLGWSPERAVTVPVRKKEDADAE